MKGGSVTRYNDAGNDSTEIDACQDLTVFWEGASAGKGGGNGALVQRRRASASTLLRIVAIAQHSATILAPSVLLSGKQLSWILPTNRKNLARRSNGKGGTGSAGEG